MVVVVVEEVVGHCYSWYMYWIARRDQCNRNYYFATGYNTMKCCYMNLLHIPDMNLSCFAITPKKYNLH